MPAHADARASYPVFVELANGVRTENSNRRSWKEKSGTEAPPLHSLQ